MNLNKDIAVSEKQDAFNRILQFMTDGDITLLAQEEQILRRWVYADKLLLQRKYKEADIIDKITSMFDVSTYTARRDMYQAQALFASMIKVNKKYLLHHHAERINLEIERCRMDKSLAHLVPKLMDAYTKAVVSIPDEINKQIAPAPVLVFNVISGQSIPVAKSYDEAIASIMKRQKEKEFTDFEELDNDQATHH